MSTTVNAKELLDLFITVMKVFTREDMIKTMSESAINDIIKSMICDKEIDIDKMFPNKSEEYRNIVKKLKEHFNSSICEDKDETIEVTCDMMYTLMGDKDKDDVENTEKLCSELRPKINEKDSTTDMLEKILLEMEKIEPIPKYPNDPDENDDMFVIPSTPQEFIKGIKEIPEEKLKPLRKLISLLLSCDCNISLEKPKPTTLGVHWSIILFCTLVVVGIVFLLVQFSQAGRKD